MPDLSSLSWLHRAEIVLVVGVLALLALAPKLERNKSAVVSIAFGAVLGALACGLQDVGLVRYAIVTGVGIMAVGLLLLPSAEMFDGRQRPEAAALILVGGLGAIVLAISGSILELALGVEMISLAGATLIALSASSQDGKAKDSGRALEGAFKYFVLTAVTFAGLLFGMALVFLGTGSVDVPALGTVAEGLRPLVIAGLLLISVGVAFKLAVFPVHFGALDAYTAGSPAFVVFLMLASKLGAALALGKIALAAGASLESLFVAMGLLTMLVGVGASFAQTDLRRLMAYSAVAHAGFLAVGAGSGALGVKASAFYVLCYAAAAALCFAALAGRGLATIPLQQLRQQGLSRLSAVGLLIGLASLAGVPPLPGFWAKLAVLDAAWQQHGLWVTFFTALGGVVGIIYYLRPTPDLLALSRASNKAQGSDVATTVVVIVTLLLTLLLGVAPGLGWALLR